MSTPNELWLLVDVSFLAWRSYYSTGQLKGPTGPTGVTFGVLRELKALEKRFQPTRIALCFDKGRPLRAKAYQGYKQSRKTLDPADMAKRQEVRGQVRWLRDEILEELGYRNICYARGFEADDVIADLALGLRDRGKARDRAVIVSTDHDLWQLLSDQVSMWNPRSQQLYGERDFINQWKLSPIQWSWVKAIAGCSTDDIQGVKGVGEATAAKYLRGMLKESTVAYKAIESGEAIWKPNHDLVKLPYPGCPKFTLKEDSLDEKNWNKVVRKLGFPSLVDGLSLSKKRV